MVVSRVSLSVLMDKTTVLTDMLTVPTDKTSVLIG